MHTHEQRNAIHAAALRQRAAHRDALDALNATRSAVWGRQLFGVESLTEADVAEIDAAGELAHKAREAADADFAAVCEANGGTVDTLEWLLTLGEEEPSNPEGPRGDVEAPAPAPLPWIDRLIAAGHATRSPGRVEGPVTLSGYYATDAGWFVRVALDARQHNTVDDVGYSAAYREAEASAEARHGAWGPDNDAQVTAAIVAALGLG